MTALFSWRPARAISIAVLVFWSLPVVLSPIHAQLRETSATSATGKQPSASVRLPSRASLHLAFHDMDCPDFATHGEAQQFYLENGGPEYDPHRLDRDRDGLACECNPGGQCGKTSKRPMLKCFIEANGNTYTIRADGSRNYAGC